MGYKSQGIHCKGTAKSTGLPCENFAMLGALVCHKHGGNAGQVKAKAAERLDNIQVSVLERMELLVPKAVRAFERVLDDPDSKPADLIKAGGEILDRFVAKKIHAEVENTQEERSLDEEIAAADREEETG